MSNIFKWKLSIMVFKREQEKEKQSPSDPEKIVLEYTRSSIRNLTLLKNFRTHQNVLKQGNKKEGGKTAHTFTISVSLQKTEMKNSDFLKASAYNGISLLAVTFLFSFSLRNYKNNSPIKADKM